MLKDVEKQRLPTFESTYAVLHSIVQFDNAPVCLGKIRMRSYHYLDHRFPLNVFFDQRISRFDLLDFDYPGKQKIAVLLT